MAIVVMLCFARSGGTVLNQCLGCLPYVLILSEVNPLGGGSGKGNISYQSVKEQAKNWYDIELKSDDFVHNILELEKICADTGRSLIVRDWTFVNFTPFINNNWNPPNKLLTLEGLSGKSEVISFAFVRDSIDVWISRGTPDVKNFFSQYLRYIHELLNKNIRIFKYEKFCLNPQKLIYEICQFTGLKYSESFKHYSQFHQINGDVQVLSRGQIQGKIKPLHRKLISQDKIVAVNQCSEMIEANNLLGYPISYYDVNRENIGIKYTRKLNRIIRLF
ncbi:hypothetical protein [Coleofasciculus sp.]|uniref:hypothetical protein n=1 Tax=Coleofasciculus sp. TaxID=3100458 RepID=UPI0039FB7272